MKSQSQLLVIFGASGDLTMRKLIPALFDMFLRELLPKDFAVLGASRTLYSDEEFREKQLVHLREIAGTPEEKLDRFKNLLFYCAIDTNSSQEYSRLKEKIQTLQTAFPVPDRVIYYLATPPEMYMKIPRFLYENNMHTTSTPGGWRRIIIEKPFGENLASAQELNAELKNIFPEENIYRIDHYLGKETVQNLLVLRFANNIFEPLWNRTYIDSVEIIAYEELGIENRGKYYDHSGALRDMVQNHLMELMAFTAMEPPAVIQPEPMRDEIVKVIRSLRPIPDHLMDRLILRGQYSGYLNEKDVSPVSVTETWVGMKLYIDNQRWSDVPFYFYTGKKTADKRSEIIIHFKSTPHILFAGQCAGGSCNQLIIRIQPHEGMTLRFGLKVPGEGFRVTQVGMDFSYSGLAGQSLPDAYVRLLMDAMEGDSTLYPRSDALEASWLFIDPVLDYWKLHKGEGLQLYPPGQDGPPHTFHE